MSILITGANRGIGLALADGYRAAGAAVVATSRGGGDHLLQLDVTRADDLARVAGQIGALDLLICNAGVYLDKGQDLEAGYAPQLWADTFAANVTGVS